ncbi:proconvertase P-domain protein, partial [Vibrio parahaemolyticus VP2007-007]
SFAIRPVLSLEIITTLMCGSMVSINRNAPLCCRLTKTAKSSVFSKALKIRLFVMARRCQPQNWNCLFDWK